MKDIKILEDIINLKEQINNLELVASNVTMSDGGTVEDVVTQNKTSILSLQELVGQANTQLISIVNEIIEM